MKKNTIKLNESQLRQIVKESVKKNLMESEIYSNTWKSGKKVENNTVSAEFKTLCDRIEKYTHLTCELDETIQPHDERIGYDNYGITIYINIPRNEELPIDRINLAYKLCKAFDPSAYFCMDDINVISVYFKDLRKFHKKKYNQISSQRLFNREYYK